MAESIIIDGCNVAECVCYQKEVHIATEIFYNHCLETNKCCGSKDNYNCYFKQLQRAKEELEQYKIKYPIIDCYRCKNSQENKVLQAENERLKQALEEAREWLLKWQFNANIIKHTNELLNKINEVLND